MCSRIDQEIDRWYRHDKKLRGQEMSLAIKAYSLELCGINSCYWRHIFSKSYSSIANKKSWLSYDHNTTHWRWQSLEEVSSNHTFRPKSAPNSDFYWMQLLEYSQISKQDHFVFNISTECEMFFIAGKNFVRKIAVHRLLSITHSAYLWRCEWSGDFSCCVAVSELQFLW